jgi:two-component system, sensor histidine kinase and response regulator
MKTILLVDDDQQVITSFGFALRQAGYNVIEANSGLAALELARQHLPDLIISDINMPGGDGSTLLQDIRRDPELRTKQVVLMTGRPDLVTPRKGMEAGADDFLVKPFDREALLRCVTARFDRASINWRVEDRQLAQLRSSVPSQLPHEFFTPLGGIISLVEILRAEIPQLAPGEVKEILDDVHQSAIRLHRTLRNYLLILQLQKDPAPVAAAPLPPGEVAKAIQAGIKEALRHAPRKEDVAVQVEPCTILVKAEDLNRIVEELVDNAFKFSRQGTPVEVKMEATGRLTVSDGGRGMTAGQIGQIGAFQQFERKKNEQQGLGLGLVLVQKLAAPSEANISITSQPGQGTQVQITFPLAPSS